MQSGVQPLWLVHLQGTDPGVRGGQPCRTEGSSQDACMGKNRQQGGGRKPACCCRLQHDLFRASNATVTKNTFKAGCSRFSGTNRGDNIGMSHVRLTHHARGTWTLKGGGCAGGLSRYRLNLTNHAGTKNGFAQVRFSLRQIKTTLHPLHWVKQGKAAPLPHQPCSI